MFGFYYFFFIIIFYFSKNSRFNVQACQCRLFFILFIALYMKNSFYDTLLGQIQAQRIPGKSIGLRMVLPVTYYMNG